MSGNANTSSWSSSARGTEAQGSEGPLPRIGIIGPSEAGKTSFLAVLTRALVASGYAWSVAEGDNAYLSTISAAIENGLFPLKTPINFDLGRIRLKVTHRERHNQAFDLDMFDPPGELFETPGAIQPEMVPEYERRSRIRREVLRELSASTAIMILLDLERSTDFLKSLISRVSAEVSNNSVKRVAMVFTKADLLPWQARYRTRNARSWIEAQHAYADVRAALESKFRAEYFFASAVGWSGGAVNLSNAINIVDQKHVRKVAEIPEREFLNGEHIPDPALLRTDMEITRSIRQAGAEIIPSNQDRFMRSLPLFVDPMRCVPRNFLENALPQGGYGVHTLPGRSALTEDRERRSTDLINAWNVAEPVLWAVGLDEAAGEVATEAPLIRNGRRTARAARLYEQSK